MGNKKATGFLCLRLVPCFAYVGAEDNRKGIPFVKIVSLLCKLIQFLMVALSVTVHKALILLVFLNHPYQSLAFLGFFFTLESLWDVQKSGGILCSFIMEIAVWRPLNSNLFHDCDVITVFVVSIKEVFPVRCA